MQVIKPFKLASGETIYVEVEDMEPDEWSVEINIGMKGKATIIPVLVSGEGNGSIKVTAKWKRETGNAE